MRHRAIGVFVAFLVTGVSAGAAEYSYTWIAETSPLDPRSGPAIDSHGRVAFRGLIGGVEGIYAGSGGVLQPLITVGETYTEFGAYPDVNDSGDFAFSARRNDGREELLLSRAGELMSLALTGNDISRFDGAISLNSGGEAAFKVVYADGNESIMRTIGGMPTEIASKQDLGLEQIGAPSLSDSGKLVFWGQWRPDSIRILEGIHVASEEGVRIVDSVELEGLHDNWSRNPVINSRDNIVYGEQFTGVLYLSNSEGTDKRLIGGGYWPNINELDAVVVQGGQRIYGLGSISGTVIAAGDPIFGSTVTDVQLFQNALNDAGQIAFAAELADGRFVIARADPIPEPSFGLLAIVAGSVLLRPRQRARTAMSKQ